MRLHRYLAASSAVALSGVLGFLASPPAQAGGLDSITANPANAPLLADPNLAAGTIDMSAFEQSVASGSAVGGGQAATGETATALVGQGGLVGEAGNLGLGATAFGGGLALLLGGAAQYVLNMPMLGATPQASLPAGDPALSAVSSSPSSTVYAAPPPLLIYTSCTSCGAGGTAHSTVTSLQGFDWGTPRQYSGARGYGGQSGTFMMTGSFTPLTAPVDSVSTVVVPTQTQTSCEQTPTTWTSTGTGSQIYFYGNGSVWNYLADTGGCTTAGNGLGMVRIRFPASYTSTGGVATYSPWYYVHPNGSPDLVGQSSHYVQQTITCTKQDGTTVTVTNSGSPSIWSPGEQVTVAGLMCPNGGRLVHQSSVLKTPGAADVPLTSGYPPASTSSIPRGCDLSGAGCYLDLQQINASGTSSCFDTGAAVSCADWYSVAQAQTDLSIPRYQCRYGNGGSVTWQVLPLSDCYIYKTAWTTGTLAQPYPDPGTSTGTGTSPGPAPTAGTAPPPVDTYQPNPTATPSTPIDAQPGPVPGPATDGSSCIAAAWSWNPLDWVMVPVECALTWAFVPDQATLQAAGQTVTSAFDGSVIGDLVTGISAYFTPFGGLVPVGGGFCEGPDIDWTLSLPAIGGSGGRGGMGDQHLVNNWHPWSWCSDPAATVSTYWINLSSFVTYFAAAMYGIRAILSAFGMGFDLADEVNGIGEAEARAEAREAESRARGEAREFETQARLGLKSAFLSHGGGGISRVERARRTGR